MRFSLEDNAKTSYVILFAILVAISYLSRGVMRLEDMIYSLPGVIIAIHIIRLAVICIICILGAKKVIA